MRRVAYLSPLPPDATGIADYSAELLPALRDHLDLDVFTGNPHRVGGLLPSSFRIRPYSEFPKAVHTGGYDALVYQLGNSITYHGEIYRLLLKYPGIVVLHEYMLHNLIRAIPRGGADITSYREEMRYCYGQTGAVMARELFEAGDSPELWSFPLFERAVDASLALIVHNETTRRRILASRPCTRVAVVPHHLSLGGLSALTSEEQVRVRARLGLPQEGFLVASFGHVTPAKRVDISLKAFARLRLHRPDAVYVLAGEISPEYAELPDLLTNAKGNGVIVTGRLLLQELLELMATCDVAINLRHPTGGETSGACMRLLGLGKPLIVSDDGWFSEIPNDCCAKVEIGAAEDEHLASLLRVLADDPGLRGRMGHNARRWAHLNHRLDDSARGYAEFVEKVITDVPDTYEPAPPLKPYDVADPALQLIVEISGAITQLGVSETDRDVQRAVAEALVSLNLDLPLSPIPH